MAEAHKSDGSLRYSDVRDSVKGKSKKTWKEVTVGPRQFKIRGPLGKGGFSEVYAGEDSETGKRVALKMMFEVQEDETTYKQTCDEIKMMRKLSHENLIKLLGYDLHAEYRDRKCVILVQELAPNRELFEYLLHSRETFKEPLVMYIGHQIFSAIQFMHGKGIAHRDLKPENILLDKEFRLKIADFGFAKFFRKNDQAVKMRTELGTRGYMAPEISAGSHVPRAKRQSYDERVDVFALGVIMFICFAGFPPFRQTNSEDWWFDKIIKKEWNYFWKAHERKAKFSGASKELLQKMLAAKAEDRNTVDECLKSNFITNNPAGKMMDKMAYTEEMKQRYKYVKAAIKKAKEKKLGKDRDIASALQSKEFRDSLEQYTDFIPAPVLCQNDIRFAVYSAPEEKVVGECAKACAATKDIPVAQYKQFIDDITSALSEYESEDLRNLFSNATDEEDFEFLIDSGIQVDALLKSLNHCVIGDDVPVPMDGDNSLAQYVAFDNGENLEMYDPEVIDETPNTFHVKFGLGTFIHLIRQYATHMGEEEQIKMDNGVKTISFAGIEFDDFESGTAQVKYEIEESGEVDGENFELSEELLVEVKLWQLLPKYIDTSGGSGETFKTEEVPGFALTVREVRNRGALNMSAADTSYVIDKLLKESELIELCH